MSDADTSELMSWRDGDIYFWSWKQPAEHMPYHCCARKAIVRGKYLVDTFWSSPSDGRSWTQEQALERLHLEYKGNFDELEHVQDYLAQYYEPADLVNLNHPNSSRDNLHLRKAAKRSKEKMLAAANYKIERSISEISMAEDRIKRLEAEKIKINDGKLDEVCL